MELWFFLSLLAPLCWGLANILDATLRRHFIRNDFVLTWVYAFFRWPVFVALFLVYGFEFPNPEAGWGMLFAGSLWTLMFVPYFQALKREEPTRIALFLQTLSLFNFLLAFLILEETLTGQQAVAFLLILLGGVLAAVKHFKGLWRFSSGFFLMLLACFFWALSDVLFKKYSGDFSNFGTAFGLFLMGSSLTSLVLPFSPRVRRGILTEMPRMKGSGWLLLSVALALGITGSFAFAYALLLGKVALTSIFTESQPLFVFFFTIVLSRFFKWVDPEDLSTHAVIFKVLSLVFIGLGLVLLYF